MKRFGTQISDASISYDALESMDLVKYRVRIQAKIENKDLFIVPSHGWSEHFLGGWFLVNYHTLKFDNIRVERSPDYLRLKKKMGFYGYPDFLALRSGEWLRVEVECFSSQYHYAHDVKYAEVLLCYEADEFIFGVELVELKHLLGVSEIINQSEIFQYLYLTDSEFKTEMDSLIQKSIEKKMGIG